MILSDGFFKKKCELTRDQFKVDGVPYHIYKLEEIIDFKSRYKMAARIWILGGVFALPYLYRGTIGLFDNSDGVMDSIITGTFGVLGLFVYGFIGYCLYRQMGYESYWRINDEYNIYICVERHDDPSLSIKLRELARCKI